MATIGLDHRRGELILPMEMTGNGSTAEELGVDEPDGGDVFVLGAIGGGGEVEDDVGTSAVERDSVKIVTEECWMQDGSSAHALLHGAECSINDATWTVCYDNFLSVTPFISVQSLLVYMYK